MAEYLTAEGYAERNEGGYCKIPGDSGGETYEGISRNANPTWCGWKIVDQCKPLAWNEVIKNDELETLVKQLYKQQYWDTIRGDEIESQAFASYFYDWYINSQEKAIEKLHEVLNIAPTDSPFGPKTLSAVNAAGDALLKIIHERRLKYYYDHVAAVPGDFKFLKGWLVRSIRLYQTLSTNQDNNA